MKKFITLLTLLLFLNFGISETFAKELDQAGMMKVISAGVNWLKQSQEETGHFRYEYMPFMDRYIQDDHIVRQAGAVFILSEAMKLDKNNNFNLKDIVQKGLKYLDENSINANFNNYEFRCLKLNEAECTLGGVSLSLIAYLNLTEKYPELSDKYADAIQKNLNFILAMNLPQKGFRGSYYLSGNQSKTESDFYNGEALLALIRYYQKNSDPQIKSVIDELMKYFVDYYSKSWNNNFYLWGMAAIKDLYKIDPRREYLEFTRDYTTWQISGYKDKRDSGRNVCAYLEGIISAYSVLETDLNESEKEAYLEEINFWLDQSKSLQTKSGDKMNIKINREKTRKLGLRNKIRSVGGFLSGFNEPVQRIDFTQHCFSSFLQKHVDIDGRTLE